MTDLVLRNTVSNVTNVIVNALSGINTGLNATQLNSLVTSTLTNFITTSTPGLDIPLSGISVDYETNKANLEAILISNPVYKDTVLASTGNLMISIIATALTYMQMNIVRAAQEVMTDTLRIPSSALAATRFLGVRIARNIPALHKATVTRSGDLSNSFQIQPYNQFTVSSNTGITINLFNRSTIIFPINVSSVNIDLFEGLANNSINFVSNGKANQVFVLGQNDYAVSDLDIICTVNNTLWERAAYADYFSIGLWEYQSDDTVYTDDSTADGNVEITFGNGINGKIPTVGNVINIIYVTTNGQNGNLDLTNALLKLSGNLLISGTITAVGVGGTNAIDPMEYKTLGPGLFSAKYRAVNRQDHAAIARRYPGVIDAIFEGQKEIAPNDLRQMLISRCTLLTNTTWTPQNFNDFKAWYENLDMANMRIYQNPSIPYTLNITANVYCFNIAVLNTIQNQIIANLQNEFRIKAGILGYNRTISDISGIIKRSNRTLIDYFDIITPVNDTSLSKYQYVVLGTVTLNMFYTSRSGL